MKYFAYARKMDPIYFLILNIMMQKHFQYIKRKEFDF